MPLQKKAYLLVLILSLAIFGCSVIVHAEQDTTASNSMDSVNVYLKNANQALNSQDQNAAINELLKAIKEQQAIIEKIQKTQSTPAPAPINYSTASGSQEYDNPSFLKQLANALPFVGGKYGDAEDQWRKAYQLQHKAIFDLRRNEAKPVFEQAITEYRVLVDTYPLSKRAPQAQRQIAWIYQTQLKNQDQARIEWSKLVQLFPKSQYVGEAKSELRELESEAKK